MTLLGGSDEGCSGNDKGGYEFGRRPAMTRRVDFREHIRKAEMGQVRSNMELTVLINIFVCQWELQGSAGV